MFRNCFRLILWFLPDRGYWQIAAIISPLHQDTSATPLFANWYDYTDKLDSVCGTLLLANVLGEIMLRLLNRYGSVVEHSCEIPLGAESERINEWMNGWMFNDTPAQKQQGFINMHHPTDRIVHYTAFVTTIVEHWLEREIAAESEMLNQKEWMNECLTAWKQSERVCNSYVFCSWYLDCMIGRKERKEMFYLIMHSAHFVYSYKVSYMW